MGWNCDCAGVAHATEAVRCDEAMLNACGVKYTAAHYCESPLATCLPENDEGDHWLCRCGEDSVDPGAEVPNVRADDCGSASLLACGESCESRFGSCESSSNPAKGFVCLCAMPFALPEENPRSLATPVWANVDNSCESTLAQTCGASCTTETGSCTIDDTGFACTCTDGSSSSVDISELWSPEGREGLDLCNDSLHHACGYIATGESCSSMNAGWMSTCETRPYLTYPDQEVVTFTFDCECDEQPDGAATAPPDGGASDAGFRTSTAVAVDAPNCGAAIIAACPGAVRPGTDPDGPTLDYGHRCETDSDCAHEACYVPGGILNPICSKRCNTDADCPDFAHCIEGAGGYCFVRCTETEECLQLNPEISENPLYCSVEYDHDGPGVCVQESEP